MKSPALTAKAVFDHAHEITSPAERKAYLDQVCAGAPELRQKVEALLQAYEAAGSSFLKPPALSADATGPYQPGEDTPGPTPDAEPETADTAAPTDHGQGTEGLGTQIGPYRLVQQLGEGGMGAVYLAEQEQPIRRQVALKIIRPGMDSAQIVARFETERQALTLMEHDNIARVFDAGTTEAGRPYFVMELVKGVPMTRFCNDNRLTPRERLELFVPVCQAIQHAHQKGIMHRDIKPSNVLVAVQDGKPVAKVIDFGLAKATEQPLTDHPQLTQAGSIAGTLEYMSPEQADPGTRGVDTRTDVYSLGVMLYELLTGTTPLDRPTLRGAGLIDVVLRIKEEEPPRPSARVSELGERLAKIAAERKTEPARLAKLLRGELDWIVMKALEKDRDRRYETANGFSNDVQHYLDDEPVEACPPSTRYRLGKLARKYRTALAGVLAFVALLVVGVVVSAWLAVRATAAEGKAVTAEKKAVTAEKVMREGYDLADATVDVSVRSGTKLNDDAKKILHKALAHHPDFLRAPDGTEEERATAAGQELLVARILFLAEDYPGARKHYDTAIQRYEELAQAFPGKQEYRYELARTTVSLAILLHKLDKRREAEAVLLRAIDWQIKLVEDFPGDSDKWRDLADKLNNLGVYFREQQDLAMAETALRGAVTLGEKVAAAVPDARQYRIDLAAGYHNLGNAVRDQRKAEAALTWYGKAIEMLTPIKPRPADATLFLRNAYWDRANARGQLNQHAEATKDWRQTIELDEGPARGDLRLFLATAQMEVKLKAESNPAAELLYQAAALHAQAAAAAATQDEAGLQKQYADRALGLLKQAAAAGWFRDPQRIKRLKDDKDFAKLPGTDFKTFLERLEAGKGVEDRPEKK